MNASKGELAGLIEDMVMDFVKDEIIKQHMDDAEWREFREQVREVLPPVVELVLDWRSWSESSENRAYEPDLGAAIDAAVLRWEERREDEVTR